MANNIETTRVLKNINNLKNFLISNFDNNHNIIQEQLIFNDVEISYQAFNAMIYSMERSWFTNNILARLFMAAKYYPNEFNWNTVFSGDFESELTSFNL